MRDNVMLPSAPACRGEPFLLQGYECIRTPYSARRMSNTKVARIRLFGTLDALFGRLVTFTQVWEAHEVLGQGDIRFFFS